MAPRRVDPSWQMGTLSGRKNSALGKPQNLYLKPSTLAFPSLNPGIGEAFEAQIWRCRGHPAICRTYPVVASEDQSFACNQAEGQGLGFRVQGLRFRFGVQGLRFLLKVLGLNVRE